MKVDNAIIMAAGASSRFAPLSYEKHKAMIEVKGEILIERQIRQLIEAEIPEIYIVTGYKAEQFSYLTDKFGVKLIYNPEYLIRNNNGSIWKAKDVLNNSFVCSADNFFSINPFENNVEDAYYAAVYADGYTDEWCMETDEEGYISSVTIGGKNAWYMLGHTFWNEDFSKHFLTILEKEYNNPETIDKLWENVFIDHLDELKMRIKKYAKKDILEFDTLDELRQFDVSYKSNTRSVILKRIAQKLKISESEIINISTIKGDDASAIGCEFDCAKGRYKYFYENKELKKQ